MEDESFDDSAPDAEKWKAMHPEAEDDDEGITLTAHRIMLLEMFKLADHIMSQRMGGKDFGFPQDGEAKIEKWVDDDGVRCETHILTLAPILPFPAEVTLEFREGRNTHITIRHANYCCPEVKMMGFEQLAIEVEDGEWEVRM